MSSDASSGNDDPPEDQHTEHSRQSEEEESAESESGSHSTSYSTTPVPEEDEGDMSLRGEDDFHRSRLRHPGRQDLTTTHARLDTFRNTGWPHSQNQSPEEMAKAGFYYTGPADLVRWFCCGEGLQDWESQDDPLEEHARWFPACTHIATFQQQRAENTQRKQDKETELSIDPHLLRRHVPESSAETEEAMNVHPHRPLPKPQYVWSEHGLAQENMAPVQVSESEGDSDRPMPASETASPLMAEFEYSKEGVWLSGSPPVTEEGTRCLHCRAREKEVLQDCGHCVLCSSCVFCKQFWTHHLDQNGGRKRCLECGKEFESFTFPAYHHLALGFRLERPRNTVCGCYSRRG
ncbi:uncharacterized protein LOC143298323 isoform X2 [Babylonia areolata]|uniref:uncharacterized protein LOC143298323 isoform X2 n=1 Tax=Babylonia areolata TaxID=304850 RepID=UPI003FD43A6E